MLNSGQTYAVDFLKSLGLTLTSTPLQLNNGTLSFVDKNGNRWAIFKKGYLRKWRDYDKNSYSFDDKKPAGFPHNGEWGVIHNFNHELEDDEYMDAAELLSSKVARNYKKAEKNYRESYVNHAAKILNDSIKELLSPTTYGYGRVAKFSKEEIVEAIKKIYEKYVKE
jgi:hypothetical protein